MSNGHISQIYKGYQIIVEKIDEFWKATIYSQNSNNEVVFDKQIVWNAKNCNRAIKDAMNIIDNCCWEFFLSNESVEFYIRLNFEKKYEYMISSNNDKKIFGAENKEDALEKIDLYVKNHSWNFQKQINNVSIYTKQTTQCLWEFQIRKNETCLYEETGFETEKEAVEKSMCVVNDFLWEKKIKYTPLDIYIRQNTNGFWNYKIEMGGQVISTNYDNFDDKNLMLVIAVGQADKYIRKYNHQVE